MPLLASRHCSRAKVPVGFFVFRWGTQAYYRENSNYTDIKVAQSRLNSSIPGDLGCCATEYSSLWNLILCSRKPYSRHSEEDLATKKDNISVEERFPFQITLVICGSLDLSLINFIIHSLRWKSLLPFSLQPPAWKQRCVHLKAHQPPYREFV